MKSGTAFPALSTYRARKRNRTVQDERTADKHRRRPTTWDGVERVTLVEDKGGAVHNNVFVCIRDRCNGGLAWTAGTPPECPKCGQAALAKSTEIRVAAKWVSAR